jgi:hypothetical protein
VDVTFEDFALAVPKNCNLAALLPRNDRLPALMLLNADADFFAT